jgi:hypothetical protein
VFAGTVIVVLPLQAVGEGHVSAAAPAGSETALRVHPCIAPVVLSATSTLPPLLVGSVVDCGVNEAIVAPGPA